VSAFPLYVKDLRLGGLFRVRRSGIAHGLARAGDGGQFRPDQGDPGNASSTNSTANRGQMPLRQSLIQRRWPQPGYQSTMDEPAQIHTGAHQLTDRRSSSPNWSKGRRQTGRRVRLRTRFPGGGSVIAGGRRRPDGVAYSTCGAPSAPWRGNAGGSTCRRRRAPARGEIGPPEPSRALDDHGWATTGEAVPDG
jgi:hypothetical protein